MKLSNWSLRGTRPFLMAFVVLLVGTLLLPKTAAAGGSRQCVCTIEGQTVGGCTWPFMFCCDGPDGGQPCGCVFLGLFGSCVNDQ
jgi:hypothetical protein